MLYLVKYDNNEVLLKDIQQVVDLINRKQNIIIQKYIDPNKAIKVFYPIENTKTPRHQANEKDKLKKLHYDAMEGLTPKSAVAYTDGSWDPKTKKMGAGVVLFYMKKSKKKQQQFGQAQKTSNKKNGAFVSEIFAVFEAVKWCVQNKRNKLTVFCDNEQVINNESNFFKNVQVELKENTTQYKKISLKIVKMTAHCGNEYNDKAHKLANKARKSNR